MLLGAVFLALAASSQALQKISRTGRYLYGEDGNRFYIKGVSYQEQGDIASGDPTAFPEPTDFTDPLAAPSACSRDIPYLQQLGVNAIRVYSVDATKNHDSCMSALSAANIYTIIDLSLPVNGSLDRASPSWTTNLLDLYIQTIDAFSKYDNVLAYNVGNEVATSPAETVTGPYVKAAVRDIKAYLKSKNYSALVGYAATDGSNDWRTPYAEYLSCNDDATSLDIYGLNNYEWCGDQTFQSAYVGVENAFANYNIPAYFSEFGCITSPPRLWTEVGALFSGNMTPAWSGGLAFSYFPAVGGYGLVNISTDGNTVTTGDDFNRLKTQYSTVSFTNSPAKASAGTTSFPTCPQTGASFNASTTLPPTPNEALCKCVASSFSCVFTPSTPNTTTIIGDLLNYGCAQLGQSGGSCSVIGGDGGSGTYGSLSACDPSIKLSYVMSSLYESTNRNPQTCDFAGNATVNGGAPPSRASAEAAAQSCISATPASTFVPTGAPAATGSSSSSASGSSSSSTKKPNAGTKISVFGDLQGLVGLSAVMLISVASGMWVLL